MRSDRSDKALLAEICESIELIGQYIAGLTPESFEIDPLRRDATAFRLLMIGEAAKGLSPAVTERLPDIDWRGMIGLRHRLAHDYGSANFNVLWTTADQDVPALADALAKL